MDRLGCSFLGGGEISVVSTPTRWRLRVSPFLPEGRRVHLFPTPRSVPGETLGLVRAAASWSSLSFLEVLLGTRRFIVLGEWWEFSEGRSGCGSSSFSSIRRCRYCFLFFFSFFSFGLDCAVCPSNDLVVSCGYYINIAGRKPVLRSIINPYLTQPDGLGDILHRSVLGK
jgi:hypothetical protein